jgi:hypothetical protein
MAGIQAPQDITAVDANKQFNRVWYALFHKFAKKFNLASRVDEVTTADATDLATALVLVNELKDVVNELSAAMRAE